MQPYEPVVNEQSVVAFQVADIFDPDTARGDYTGAMLGVVRPLFDWNTRLSSQKSLKMS